MEEHYRICFLQYNLCGGGAERKVCTLANTFAAMGHEVEIGLFGTDEVAYDLDGKVKVTYIRRDSYEYNGGAEKAKYRLRRFVQRWGAEKPAALLEKTAGALHLSVPASLSRKRVERHFWKRNEYAEPLERFIEKHQDGILITMMVSTYLAVWEVMEPRWKDGLTVPYIVMDCSDPKHNADGSMDERRTRYYAKASRCLVMTQGAKDYFAPEVQEKTVIIPNPVRNDLPEPYTGTRRKAVVNYCRLNVQKNLPLLIRSFARFHREYPEYTLDIYGEGGLRDELNGLAAELGISDCAAIRDFDPHIHAKIRDAAMFVSSADWEGFPNSVLEALALGMPVISTDCDFGPRDMIRDHENGILIPTGDEDAMVRAMCELAADEELRDRLASHASAAASVYAPDKIAAKWIDLIGEVMKEKR